MNPITKRQQQVLDFILSSVRERGFQPSYREIAEHLGVRTPNGVYGHIKSLRVKGYVGGSSGGRAVDLTGSIKKGLLWPESKTS